MVPSPRMFSFVGNFSFAALGRAECDAVVLVLVGVILDTAENYANYINTINRYARYIMYYRIRRGRGEGGPRGNFFI